MAAFRCRICGRFFRPDPRKRGRSPQKTCGRVACRRQHKGRNNQSWALRHPGYGKSRKLKIRAWAKAHPDYWQRYRAGQPAYQERERQRMRSKRKRLRRVAKQAVIGQITVEKLLAVKRIRSKSVAKQAVIARR
ncbi:MAG: hypothetical protein AAB263_11495, partial [Planctomycetota bacterium]